MTEAEVKNYIAQLNQENGELAESTLGAITGGGPTRTPSALKFDENHLSMGRIGAVLPSPQKSKKKQVLHGSAGNAVGFNRANSVIHIHLYASNA